MNPYHHLVAEYARLVREGRQLPLGGFPPASRPALAAGAPSVLIFSPHPDDECVIGALALRLLREAGRHVINVAVTQGSNRARQAARLEELRQACAYLGFDLESIPPHGLEQVHVKTRAEQPEAWGVKVRVVAEILRSHAPEAIFFPHDRDWNSTHIGVHHLVVDALRSLGPAFTCATVETEFWGQMDDPNLMVESTAGDVGDLVTATSFHAGEVARNPYHLLQAAWMQDNIRRGGELVGGQGQGPPDFQFATLYRWRRWEEGRFVRGYAGGRQLAAGENPAVLFA